MDYNWIAQTVIMLMVGALTYFMKRTLDKIETNVTNLAQKLEKIDEKHGKRYDDLEKQFNDLKADMPFIYTTREDFIRVMNGVDAKLDKIIYGKGGNIS